MVGEPYRFPKVGRTGGFGASFQSSLTHWMIHALCLVGTKLAQWYRKLGFKDKGFLLPYRKFFYRPGRHCKFDNYESVPWDSHLSAKNDINTLLFSIFWKQYIWLTFGDWKATNPDPPLILCVFKCWLIFLFTKGLLRNCHWGKKMVVVIWIYHIYMHRWPRNYKNVRNAFDWNTFKGRIVIKQPYI